MTRSFTHSARGDGRSLLSRRQWLQLSAAGAMGVSLSGWLEPWVSAARSDARQRRSCILLWMDGGPSQLETFDLKPGHANGGTFKEMATAVPGIKISEHLPRVAAWMKHMAIIRSMNTVEADHGRGAFLLHTGYSQAGGIQYPSLGALVSQELSRPNAVLPNFVSVDPDLQYSSEAYGSGFLGPMHAPLRLGKDLQVPNLTSPHGLAQSNDRIALLQQGDEEFAGRHPGTAGRSHLSAYERAVRLMQTEAKKAFEVEAEPAKVRDAYGRNPFGQGCLLARRLVERGVPFVEVSMSQLHSNGQQAWDTHQDIFARVQRLSQDLDSAWSSLMQDLHDRGLLDTTLIVWMGEFGRDPRIGSGSNRGGRDHYATAWSTVLAGGCIRGGQVVGKTSADGMTITERPVKAADFLATICLALGMDPAKMNTSNTGRPIPLAEETAQPIRELLA